MYNVNSIELFNFIKLFFQLLNSYFRDTNFGLVVGFCGPQSCGADDFVHYYTTETHFLQHEFQYNSSDLNFTIEENSCKFKEKPSILKLIESGDWFTMYVL